MTEKGACWGLRIFLLHLVECARQMYDSLREAVGGYPYDWSAEGRSTTPSTFGEATTTGYTTGVFWIVNCSSKDLSNMINQFLL